jgi:hypothetical protein
LKKIIGVTPIKYAYSPGRLVNRITDTKKPCYEEKAFAGHCYCFIHFNHAYDNDHHSFLSGVEVGFIDSLIDNKNLTVRLMKKTKSFPWSLMVSIALVCVMSCDEQDEKLKVENDFDSKGKVARANKRAGAVNFDGSEGDPIDVATARNWTSNFRNTTEGPDEIVAHYFGTDIIQKILDEPGCVGIRIYYALDDAGEKKLLLVGVDANGENLLPLEGGRTNDEGDVVADYSWPCPDYCPGNGL